jgi:hypothetical protein
MISTSNFKNQEELLKMTFIFQIKLLPLYLVQGLSIVLCDNLLLMITIKTFYWCFGIKYHTFKSGML